MACHGNKYYIGYTPKDMEDSIKNVSSGEYTSQRVPFYMEFPEKLSGKMNNKHTNPNQDQHKTNTPDFRWGKVSHKLYSLHGRACFPLNNSTDAKIWQVVIASGRAAQFKNTGPSEKRWRGFKNTI